MSEFDMGAINQEHQKMIEEKQQAREKLLKDKSEKGKMHRRTFLKVLGLGTVAIGLGVKREEILKSALEYLKNASEEDTKKHVKEILENSELQEMTVSEGRGLWELYSESGWRKKGEIYNYFEKSLVAVNPDKFDKEGKLNDPLLARERDFIVPVFKEKSE